MEKVALSNLGCTKNLVDGENIAGFMGSCGYEITNDFAIADTIIVNTCTFIKEATQEAIDTVLEMAAYKTTGSCKRLIVSGCFSQRYREEARADLPEVDFWVSVDSWKTDLAGYLKTKEPKTFHRRLTEPVSTQYLKISEGCSHRCTYCIIPSIRGDFKSRAIAELVDEALWLESQGVKELIVVSQDTSFYGRDIGTTLADLLKTLLAKTGFPWIRMMYLHPQFVDDALLDVVAKNPRLTPYFDIPLQHVSDAVLTSMKRLPLKSGTYDVVSRIRSKIPDAAIRTSFIVGYPGETAKDFKELAAFVEWARFDRMGVFPYSPEDGTVAAEMKGRPRTATVNTREEELMSAQKTISAEIAESRVGKILAVIIDRVSDNPDYSWEGRTRYDAPEVDGRVWILDGDFTEGSIVDVEIVDADDYDLFARAIKK